MHPLALAIKEHEDVQVQLQTAEGADGMLFRLSLPGPVHEDEWKRGRQNKPWEMYLFTSYGFKGLFFSEPL